MKSEVRLSLTARNQKLPRYPSNSSLCEFNHRVVHTSTDELLGLVTEALASPTRTTKSYSSIPCAHELVLDYLEGVEHDSAILYFGVLSSWGLVVSLFYMKSQIWPKCRRIFRDCLYPSPGLESRSGFEPFPLATLVRQTCKSPPTPQIGLGIDFRSFQTI